MGKRKPRCQSGLIARTTHTHLSEGVWDVQFDQHHQWWSSGLSRTKLCGKCGQRKTLPEFPCDKSRGDERWHTCKQCNGKRLRLLRLAESGRKKWEIMFSPAPANPRRRLEGLKSYRKK